MSSSSSSCSEKGTLCDEYDGEPITRATNSETSQDKLHVEKHDVQLREDDEELTVREAIKLYKWAIFWCLAVSMTVIMEGYGTILISNFWAYPTFQKKYGHWVGITLKTRSGYQLSPAWQAALGNSSVVGAVFGSLGNGHLVNHFGQRIIIVSSLMLLSLSTLITFFAPNPPTLLLGLFLSGLPWGVFATSAPVYASEMLPMALRVYFTSWSNMCFIIGQFIAAAVLRGFLSRDDEWGFRVPFGLQWVWMVVLIPLLSFAPESPWHLVRKGRVGEAEATIRRLTSGGSSSTDEEQGERKVDAKKVVAAIVLTDELEKRLTVGTSYKDCFKGVELRRTEIACMAFAGKILCGAPLAYNATYFYEQIGLEPSAIYNFNIGGYAFALVGALGSWFIIFPRVGRRPLFLYGTMGMLLILFTIGISASWDEEKGVAESQAYLAVLWKFVAQLSSAQLGWVVPSEVGSTRVRQKTVVVARNAFYLALLLGGILQPYFMNPKAWNVGARTGFFWGGIGLLWFIWAWFRLPETKGRNFDELDILFAQKVPARKFSKTNVDIFHFDDLAQEHEK